MKAFTTLSRVTRRRTVAESTGGQSLLGSVRTGLDLDGLKWKKPWKTGRIPSVITAVIEQPTSDTTSFDHNAHVVNNIVGEQINTSDYEVASIISKDSTVHEVVAIISEEVQERSKLFSSCLCHKVDEIIDCSLNACNVEVDDDNTSPPSNNSIQEEWFKCESKKKKNRNRLRTKSKKHNKKGSKKSNSDLHSGTNEGGNRDPGDNNSNFDDDTYVVFVFNGEPDLTSYKNLKSVDVADLKHNTTRSISIQENHHNAVVNDVNRIIGAIETVTDKLSTSESINVAAKQEEEKIIPNSRPSGISDIHCVKKKKSKRYYWLARKRSEFRKAWRLSSG
jgi:hypothetical protein